MLTVSVSAVPLSRAQETVPKLGVGFTERNGRLLNPSLLGFQVALNLGLMVQIEGDRPINLCEFQYREAFMDRLGRIPTLEGVHHGIERDSRTRDVIPAVPFLDVLAVHQLLWNSVSHLDGRRSTEPPTMPK